MEFPKGSYLHDNTRFIRTFEYGGYKAAYCLRPRRFGESLSLSMLQL